jgi:hypothetical protein
MYSPQVPGAFQHSVVLPEAGIGCRWDGDNPPLNAGDVWRDSTQDAFLAFTTGSYAQAHFTSGKGLTWTRAVLLLHPDPAQPLLLIHDTFGGAQSGASKVSSLNLMAQGDVTVDGDRITPRLRSHQRGELPSAGKVFTLETGVRRLGFTGQWGVDWDLYVLAETPLQGQIGNWAHQWHPTPEQDEFRRATGRPFEERQDIFRLKGDGAFQMLLVPYRRGKKPDDLKVTADGDRLLLLGPKATTSLLGKGYAYRGAGKEVLAALTNGEVQSGSIRLAGGPAEVILETDKGTLTLHGEAGRRTVTLPAGWQVGENKKVGVTPGKAAGEWEVTYAGGEPVALSLRRGEER